MIRAVCFDFDGTLAQFSGDFGELIARFGLELGLSQREVTRLEQRRLQLERQGGPMTFYDTAQAAFSETGLAQPDDLEQSAENTLSRYCSQMKRLPGALEALNLCRAHKLPLALVTNGPADMQRTAVRAVGVEDYFSRILVSGDADVGVRKPNPHIFQLACEALETEPAETLMVGDNLEADVKGASGYGMQAVYLGHKPGAGYETLPDIAAFSAWLGSEL